MLNIHVYMYIGVSVSGLLFCALPCVGSVVSDSVVSGAPFSYDFIHCMKENSLNTQEVWFTIVH